MQKNISIRRSAQKLAKAGQVVKALAAYEPLITSGDADPYDHLYVGDLHERIGNRDEAIAQYEAAIRAYNKLGFHRNGVALCRKILRLAPDHRVVYRLLGDLYTGEELYGDALTAYLCFFDRTPRERRTEDEFRETLAAAVTIAPRNADMALKLAALLEDLDRLDEAAELLVRTAETARQSGATGLAADLRARADAIDPGAALRVGVTSELPATGPVEPPAPFRSPVAPKTDTIIALEADEPQGVPGETARAPQLIGIPEPAIDLEAGGACPAAEAPAVEPPAWSHGACGAEAPLELVRGGPAVPPTVAEAQSETGYQPRRRPVDPSSFGEIDLEESNGMQPSGPVSARGSEMACRSGAIEPTGQSLEPELEQVAKPEREPGPKLVPKPAPKQEPQPEPKPVPEPAPKQELRQEPAQVARQEPEREVGQESEPEPEPEPEPGPEPEPEQEQVLVIPEDAADDLEEVAAELGLAAEEERAPAGRLVDPAAATQLAMEGEQWTIALRRAEEWVQREPSLEAVEKLIEISRVLQDNAETVRGFLLKGDLLIRDGELQQAVRAFREVLRRDPQNEMALRRMTRFRELGVVDADCDHADQPGPVQAVIEARNTVVAIHQEPAEPRDERDWMEIGALLDEFREGVKEQVGENDPQAHYDLGVSHQEMGLFEEALEEFAAALACRDVPPEMELRLRELRGKCFARIDRHREAIQEFGQALEIPEVGSQESAGITYLLGLEHAQAGEVEKAKEYMREVLRLKPDFKDAQTQLDALEGDAA